VLNECIELAKEFGGTDGHKYVNGGAEQRLAPTAAGRQRSRRTAQHRAKRG
jgi:N utilization substance protein B